MLRGNKCPLALAHIILYFKPFLYFFMDLTTLCTEGLFSFKGYYHHLMNNQQLITDFIQGSNQALQVTCICMPT